jgi:hypothetical protein
MYWIVGFFGKYFGVVADLEDCANALSQLKIWAW